MQNDQLKPIMRNGELSKCDKYLLHSPMPSRFTKFQILKPELNVSLEPVGGEAVNVEDPGHAGVIGAGVFRLFAGFPLGGLLAEGAEGVELLLVVYVGEEIFLQWTVPLQTVLEIAPLFHYLSQLLAAEQTALLEVFQLGEHALELELNDFRHIFGAFSRRRRRRRRRRKECSVR